MFCFVNNMTLIEFTIDGDSSATGAQTFTLQPFVLSPFISEKLK